MERFLDVNELSAMLKMKKTSIYQAVHRKAIPHVKVSKRKLLFKEDVIKEWLNNKEVNIIQIEKK